MRRIALAAIALLLAATAACGTSDADTGGTEADQPKVAALFTQFVDQGNWDVAGYQAYQSMCSKYDFDCTYKEEATYEQAPALLRDYAQQGYDLIVVHSSGYAAAIEEVAPDFPNTKFALFSFASDLKGLKNYAAWSVDWTQYGWLQGVVAGLTTESNKIALVGGEELPSSKESLALTAKAAKSVNPAVQVSTVYIGSFTDVAKGKQIALSAVNGGADFLVPSADLAGQGVQQAAVEKGVKSVGEYLDEYSKFNSIVTSVTVNFDKAYDEIGADYKSGTWGEITQMNASTGVLGLAPFHNAKPGVEEKAKEQLAGLSDGTVKPS